jgi:hypothetical protein
MVTSLKNIHIRKKEERKQEGRKEGRKERRKEERNKERKIEKENIQNAHTKHYPLPSHLALSCQ